MASNAKENILALGDKIAQFALNRSLHRLNSVVLDVLTQTVVWALKRNTDRPVTGDEIYQQLLDRIQYLKVPDRIVVLTNQYLCLEAFNAFRR